MNEEKKESPDEFSLHKSVEVDEIIEFYKDKEFETEDNEIEVVSEKKTIFDNIKNRFKPKKNDDDIHTDIYGLSQKGRIILYRLISLCICILIICSAFVLAYYLPGNSEVLSSQIEILSNEDEYKDLKSRHDTMQKEIESIRASNEDKKKLVDEIDNYDNIKADLRAQITAKSYELNELNNQIKEKKNTISALDLQISEKVPREIILPAGKYTVSKNIVAGKYYVTGTGTFALSTAQGKSKINTTLSSSPLEVTLEANDIIKFNANVKFTLAN